MSMSCTKNVISMISKVTLLVCILTVYIFLYCKQIESILWVSELGNDHLTSRGDYVLFLKMFWPYIWRKIILWASRLQKNILNPDFPQYLIVLNFEKKQVFDWKRWKKSSHFSLNKFWLGKAIDHPRLWVRLLCP